MVSNPDLKIYNTQANENETSQFMMEDETEMGVQSRFRDPKQIEHDRYIQKVAATLAVYKQQIADDSSDAAAGQAQIN